MMTNKVYALAILTILLNAVAQILMKAGASASAAEAAPLLRAWGLIGAALLIYVIGMALWIYVLRQVELTLVYPFMALSFVVVPLLSVLFLGERVDLPYMAGVVLIMGGIYLCSAV